MALSGLGGACPASSTVTGESDNLSVGATVRDKAGNETSKTVSGIKIDRTAPSTLVSGWYAGAVQVTLNPVDRLSGVDKTFYSLDGGVGQTYSGSFSHSLGGSQTITFWSVDKAGNVEDKTTPGHTITIKIDNIAPKIEGSRTPAANSFGWNTSTVTVSFASSDAETGGAGCTDAVTLSTEGSGLSMTGTATDNAGNTASAKVENINIDLTAPTLMGAATPNSNAFG